MESRIRAAVAMLTLMTTSCESRCHDLTEDEWALEWNDLYVQRCQPAAGEWRPMRFVRNCSNENFNPRHARACLDVFDDWGCGAEE